MGVWLGEYFVAGPLVQSCSKPVSGLDAFYVLLTRFARKKVSGTAFHSSTTALNLTVTGNHVAA